MAECQNYVDLRVRDGLSLNDVIQQTKQLQQLRLEAGFDQAALDQEAKAGFVNTLFELSESEVLDEFYAIYDDQPKVNYPENAINYRVFLKQS